ncbi:MAG TPA: patatin-like phospholipase family protein [Conexibacter sp.]|nr:patatin-like phospholipase family protein [Conexibacter sp.]
MQRPDVLVLGAGGTVGAAWMGGVLAGIAAETGIDFAACEHIVGTSAGSMVAADLLAGVEPRAGGPAGAGAPAEDDEGTALLVGEPSARGNGDGRAQGRASRLAGSFASAAGSSLAPLALSLGRAPGSLVRAAALARIEAAHATLGDLGGRIAGHGLRWDGKLRVACVDRARGRRVVFGAPGAPRATVAEAVQASCSIPGIYRPVRIGDDEYVDGAVWSPTNMDAAPALRETHVLCLAPMAAQLGTRERHPAVRAATSTAIRLETLTLQRRGAIVRVVVPEPADAAERARVTGYRQGRALARAG